MIAVFAVVLPLVAYSVVAERRISAWIQDRVGPNRVGPWGLLQPAADGLKFILKEDFTPAYVRKVYFWLAPAVSMVPALLTLAVIPFGTKIGNQPAVIADLNVGILYTFSIVSLGVYGIVLAGYASNSKYPFLGALRSAAQMVSYEVSIGLVIITVLLCVGSLNLTDIVNAQKTVWFAVPLFPMFVVFFISALAETNRPPFDLPEDESALVAGFMTEYSSTLYVVFMIGELANIVLMCAMCTILFLGGWLPPVDIAPFNWVPGVVWFILKMGLMFFMFAMTKVIVPRYRYDQLMRLGWKVFLPLSLGWVVLTAGFLQYFGMAS